MRWRAAPSCIPFARRASRRSKSARFCADSRPSNLGIFLRTSPPSSSARSRMACPKTAAKRAERHDANAQLAADRQDGFFEDPGPQRVFALKRGDRLDAAPGAVSRRQLPTAREIAPAGPAIQIRPSRPRCLRPTPSIDPVQVVEIDHAEPEPLQARIATGAHAVRPRVDVRRRASAGRRNEPPNLLASTTSLAPIANRLPDELLVGALPVLVGCVDERDTQIDRPVTVRIDLASSGVP